MKRSYSQGDLSDIAVDALAIAIWLLIDSDQIAEAWTLFAFSPEPERLSMRLRCDLPLPSGGR